MSRPTRAELIEAGAALQWEAMGGLCALGGLAADLYREAIVTAPSEDPWRRAYNTVDFRALYLNACAIAAQLAAEKAGLA